MRTPALLLALAAALLPAAFASAVPAAAETLVTALSHERVAISSNFTGTEVVVFGTIERDAQTVPRAGQYDVVVTVAGPITTLVTRRKERTVGIWINADSEKIHKVPSFLSVQASRPVGEILPTPARARLGLGLDMMPINEPATTEPPRRTDFEKAFLRLMQQRNRYVESWDGVEFLGGNLFRSTIRLPADVPVGDYTATVQLFRAGALLATTVVDLHIGKIGFEQHVTDLAHQRGLLYGLATVAMALVTGWLAGVIFRRD
jgi:uncharacterized protein (TIGR02186 family)